MFWKYLKKNVLVCKKYNLGWPQMLSTFNFLNSGRRQWFGCGRCQRRAPRFDPRSETARFFRNPETSSVAPRRPQLGIKVAVEKDSTGPESVCPSRRSETAGKFSRSLDGQKRGRGRGSTGHKVWIIFGSATLC